MRRLLHLFSESAAALYHEGSAAHFMLGCERNGFQQHICERRLTHMSIDEAIGYYTYRSFLNRPVGAPNDILFGSRSSAGISRTRRFGPTMSWTSRTGRARTSSTCTAE
jgi:hypothetical protein